MDESASSTATAVEVTERRSHERRGSLVNKLVRGTIEVAGHDSRELYLYLVDVSEGGLRINCDCSIPVEESVHLSFALDGFEDLKAEFGQFEARVCPVWSKALMGGTWTIGFKYLDVNTELVEKLLVMFSAQNRRARFRLKEIYGAALRVQGEELWVDCSGVDISAEGACLRTPHHDFEEGQRVELLLSLTDRVVTPAEVRWKKPLPSGSGLVGFQFVDSDEDAIHSIEDHIKKATLR